LESSIKTAVRASYALLLALHGCGGDSGGSASFQGKKLSDLSVEERMQLCASNVDENQAITTGTCTLAALDAPAKADCEMARDQCNADTSRVTTASCQDPDMVLDFSDCTTIRVSQVESCLREASTFFEGLSCDAVGQQDPLSPGCIETLQLGCPVLFYGMTQ
jgi:hypothetical protein